MGLSTLKRMACHDKVRLFAISSFDVHTRDRDRFALNDTSGTGWIGSLRIDCTGQVMARTSISDKVIRSLVGAQPGGRYGWPSSSRACLIACGQTPSDPKRQVLAGSRWHTVGGRR